ARTPDSCDIDPQGTCQIKLTLKPDYAGNQFKGALIGSSQGLLTIQTIPPILVTLNKSDIIQENYTAPASGGCALNNIWVCKGLFVTMELTLTAFAAAIVLGLVLSLMRISSNVIMYNLATLYIEVIRGIPLLVLLLLVQFALPPWLRLVVPLYAPYIALLTGAISAISVLYYLTTRWKHRKTEPIEIVQPVATSIVLGIVVVAFILYAKATSPVGPTQTPPFRSAVIGLAVCYGAFLGELFRAGIQSVGRGQMEAGRSLGMTYIQAMRYIILPQAFRVILPALGNDFIAMLKDTSLVTILTVPEMTYQAQLYATKIFRPFEAYITIAVLYLVMTLFLSLLVRIVENRTRLPR
ncbi:MAG TPA: amino acid ABC transporter permease, partial [Aggregatilineales bacterium]|nr:amino acid ABC transporter permease [Aggregatilineales bacterium]